jgi:hypothetical protein
VALTAEWGHAWEVGAPAAPEYWRALCEGAEGVAGEGGEGGEGGKGGERARAPAVLRLVLHAVAQGGARAGGRAAAAPAPALVPVPAPASATPHAIPAPGGTPLAVLADDLGMGSVASLLRSLGTRREPQAAAPAPPSSGEGAAPPPGLTLPHVPLPPSAEPLAALDFPLAEVLIPLAPLR